MHTYIYIIIIITGQKQNILYNFLFVHLYDIYLIQFYNNNNLRESVRSKNTFCHHIIIIKELKDALTIFHNSSHEPYYILFILEFLVVEQERIFGIFNFLHFYICLFLKSYIYSYHLI